MNAKAVTASEQPGSRIGRLKRGLPNEFLILISDLWSRFRSNGEWPQKREIHSKYEKPTVDRLISAHGGGIITDRDYQVYGLTDLGIVLADSANLFEIYVRSLEWFRDIFYSDHQKNTFSRQEISEALKIEKSEADSLFVLIQKSLYYGGSSRNNEPEWSVSLSSVLEEFPKCGQLAYPIETHLLRNRNWNRRDAVPSASSILSGIVDSPFIANQHGAQTASIDPLKRRYQAFVSSTFVDLTEERKEVIQALLETKCIPTGMELFPAASLKQWDLIKRVIAECDFYIVIVAGRYGSCDEEGISFTEREFDYAVETNKRILGFYHADPEALLSGKVEKSEQAIAKLESFIEKVKMRLCRPWTTPHELGSAVKSAIISELEIEPPPGWVRADSVPASDTVERLKQKVADLQEKLNAKPPKKRVPSGIPEISKLIIDVEYAFVAAPPVIGWGEEPSCKTLKIELEENTSELLFSLRKSLTVGILLEDLKRRIEKRVGPTVHATVQERVGKQKDAKFALNHSSLEKLQDTLIAARLITISSPGYGSWSEVIVKLTTAGQQFVAEFNAGE